MKSRETIMVPGSKTRLDWKYLKRENALAYFSRVTQKSFSKMYFTPGPFLLNFLQL